MLNCIRIQGFKCFQEAEIRFSNFTLLAGKNSTGKSTVIQAILALYQNSASSLAGKYMNIGSVNEVKNWIAGSKKISLEALYEYLGRDCSYSKIFEDEYEKRVGTEFPDEIKVRYLTADRIGVEDTYPKSLEGKDKIGVRCEYAFFYLAGHKDEEIREKGFMYDSTTKTTLGGQVDYWLERILGYRVTAEEIPGTELIRVSYRNRELGRDIRPKNVGTGFFSDKYDVYYFKQLYDDLEQELRIIEKRPGKKVLFIEDYNLYIKVLASIRYYCNSDWSIVVSRRIY